VTLTRTVDEVRACVCEQLVLALSLPRESIRPESRILIDLGAESLDLLDLTFRLEDALHIKLDARELAEAPGPASGPEEFRERFTVEVLSVYLLAKLERSRAGA
jgi:acyl carrier protein